MFGLANAASNNTSQCDKTEHKFKEIPSEHAVQTQGQQTLRLSEIAPKSPFLCVNLFGMVFVPAEKSSK